MRLVASLLIAFGAASCDQSLFDSRALNASDAGPPTLTDGNTTTGDGALAKRECQAPCIADPIAEFDSKQGGLNGSWHYLSSNRMHPMIADTELVYGSFDGVAAWVAADGNAPAILNCYVTPGQGLCQGLESGLVFVPGPGVGDSDPVLVYTVPTTGMYAFDGVLELTAIAPQTAKASLTLSRNSTYDLLNISEVVATSDLTEHVSIEAIAGDKILISPVGTISNTPVVIDFRFNTDTVPFPGTCALGLNFEGETPLTDHCQGQTFIRAFDDQQAAGVSMLGPSLHSNLGMAEHFEYGQVIDSTHILDYSGDFTIQFWIKRIATGGANTFTDLDIPSKGGMSFFLRSVANLFNVCYRYDNGTSAELVACIETPMEQTQWHFIRVSRELAGDFELCIDGVSIGTSSDGTNFDMSSDSPLTLGGSSAPNTQLQGSMDEVRVFERALPCALPQ